MRVVSATANPHKLVEIQAIVGERLVVMARPIDCPEVIEDRDTLAGNALLKAQAIANFTGEAALADDTGLEVDALSGAPGVHSARYAGPAATDADNVVRLLSELGDRPDRTARFRTVIVVVGLDPDPIIVSGAVEGRIAVARLGEHGFGYDPVFIPDDGDGRTFAQMTAAEKDDISHRGRAVRALLALLDAEPT